MLALANNRSLEGEPMKVIQRALKANPDQLKALSLAGTYAFEKKDYATVDLHLAYDLGAGTQSEWLDGAVIALDAQNLFDRDPPYTNSGGQVSFQAGYDPQYADPRGRFI